MKNGTTLKLLAPLVALGLTLTACGGNGGNGEAGAAASEHNEQDVAFATEMIPHHAQAVQMSEIALENAESPEVRDLAEEIRAAQEPEIEQMSSWLEEWDEDVPDADGGAMGGMDHGGGHGDGGMPGMMSPEQMGELGSAGGASFDTMFLTMMIEHHEGAIEMARTQQAEGLFPEAIELAEAIEEAQTREIATMEQLLAR